jgi:hypothetical protein
MLRMVTAYEQLGILSGASTDTTRKLAATANFYSMIGMQIEDMAAMTVAFAAWASNPELVIADVLFKVSFVGNGKVDSTSAGMAKSFAQLTTGSGKVRINAKQFFLELLKGGPSSALGRIGIPWKQIPSVKTAKQGEERQRWLRLPIGLRHLSRLITEDGGARVGLMYNKIKHGPQLIVTDLLDHSRGMGADEEGISSINQALGAMAVSPKTLRVLLKGSLTAGEAGREPHSIFLEDDPVILKKFLLNSVFPSAKFMWSVASWLRKRHWGDDWVNPDALVRRIDEEAVSSQEYSQELDKKA